MRSKPHAKALQAMRALVAIGIHDEETLVLHGAEALAEDDEASARRKAQRVFDRHYKIMGDG